MRWYDHDWQYSTRRCWAQCRRCLGIVTDFQVATRHKNAKYLAGKCDGKCRTAMPELTESSQGSGRLTANSVLVVLRERLLEL